MKEKNEATANNTNGALFESHGMAKRTNVSFIISGIIWLSISMFHLVCFLYVPNEPEFNAGRPTVEAIAEGEAGVDFLRLHKVSQGKGATELFIIFGTAAIGICSVAFVMGGRKLYMKIYETHVEGYAGFSVMTEEVRMPISYIFSISPHTDELMPYAELYTMYGNRISFFMSAKKANEAQRVFRELKDARKKAGL